MRLGSHLSHLTLPAVLVLCILTAVLPEKKWKGRRVFKLQQDFTLTLAVKKSLVMVECAWLKL